METFLALIAPLAVAFAFAAPADSAPEGAQGRGGAPSGCGSLYGEYASPQVQYGGYTPSQYQYAPLQYQYDSGLRDRVYYGFCVQYGPDRQSSQDCVQYGGCVDQGPAAAGVRHAVDEFVDDAPGASEYLSGTIPETGRHGPGWQYDQYGPGYEQYTPGASQYGPGGPGAPQYECDQYGTCDAGEAAAGVDVIGKATEDAHAASGNLAESIPQAGSVGPASDAGDTASAGVTGIAAKDARGSDESAEVADGSSVTSAGEQPAPPGGAENFPREEVTPVAEVEAPSASDNPPSEEDGAEELLGLLPVSAMVASASVFALLLVFLVSARIFRHR